MKILLIGKTGQLGGSILKENSLHDIYAPDRSEVDIESSDTIQVAIQRHTPDLIINTAAFHNLPQCEEQPDRAFQINCVAVRNLALLCQANGIKLITFSSDYVFDGHKQTPYLESDRTNPLQVYGITRLAGELIAMATAPQHSVVIRTCGLYGHSGARSKGGSFVDNRIVEAGTSDNLEISCDQTVSPTFTIDLARATFSLISLPKLQSGIYHLVNEGECSWYEFTKTIFEILGLRTKVSPVDRGGTSGQMQRPSYSVLKNTKAAEFGIRLPHWRDALQRYLDNIVLTDFGIFDHR